MSPIDLPCSPGRLRRVNRDASHFCIGPGNGESALHGQAVPGGWSGSAGPRHARYAGGHARRIPRNRPGRGRNNYRSTPERGIPHTGTAGQTPRRRDWIGGHPVDERHDSRNTDAACVPSTVWGTASNVTAKFRSTPACPAIQASPRPAVQRRVGTQSPLPSARTSPQRPRTFTAAIAAELSIQCSPSIRGFSPPSTADQGKTHRVISTTSVADQLCMSQRAACRSGRSEAASSGRRPPQCVDLAEAVSHFVRTHGDFWSGHPKAGGLNDLEPLVRDQELPQLCTLDCATNCFGPRERADPGGVCTFLMVRVGAMARHNSRRRYRGSEHR